MAAKPLSKTKIVSHIAEKLGTPKKQPRCEGAPQGAHGPQSPDRRSNQDQGQDCRAPAPGKGSERCDSEVTFGCSFSLDNAGFRKGADQKSRPEKFAPEAQKTSGAFFSLARICLQCLHVSDYVFDLIVVDHVLKRRHERIAVFNPCFQ